MAATTQPIVQRETELNNATAEAAVLRVAIQKEGGEVLRIVTFDDPRVRFCKTFNEDSAADGLVAVILPD